MASRSMIARIAEAVSLAPASRNTNNTTTGTSVDTAGYEAVTLLAFAGAVTDGTHTYKLQESDDNATWNDVAAPDFLGAASNALAIAAAQANSVLELAYVGTKRYVRAVLTTTGATTGGVTGAIILLGHARHAPA